MGALAGKAIVITGSSRGLGAAYAKAAAAEGASVVVNGTDAVAAEQVVEEIRVAGGTAVAHVADIASWDEAEGLVQRSIDAGELLDPQARAEYKQRLEDLRAELAQSEQWGDTERAARLREEIEFLSDELSAAYGLGGCARKGADTAERIRKAVSNRIRDSIARIAFGQNDLADRS